ncbi:unnamed protein product [Schistosoma mattheei]|uniref:Uncharacterized protein n=1 Tax=Schistosoma mattheei TaxID=31246 RepID=A0A183P105_9TREM|nr:unnamed protein product [Schistosoma mattheei]
MCLHLRFDVQSGTLTQYRSLHMLSLYPLNYCVLIATFLCNGVKFKFTWHCPIDF